MHPDFKKGTEQMTEFKPDIKIYALASKVLAVATTRIEGTWKAYINAVPGIDHSEEFNDVLQYGEDPGERIARAIFPDFYDIPYVR